MFEAEVKQLAHAVLADDEIATLAIFDWLKEWRAPGAPTEYTFLIDNGASCSDWNLEIVTAPDTLPLDEVRALLVAFHSDNRPDYKIVGILKGALYPEASPQTLAQHFEYDWLAGTWDAWSDRATSAAERQAKVTPALARYLLDGMPRFYHPSTGEAYRSILQPLATLPENLRK